jgi:hypothetical protein
MTCRQCSGPIPPREGRGRPSALCSDECRREDRKRYMKDRREPDRELTERLREERAREDFAQHPDGIRGALSDWVIDSEGIEFRNSYVVIDLRHDLKWQREPEDDADRWLRAHE